MVTSSSRLYHILSNHKHDEDQGRKEEDLRTILGFPSLQRVSNGIRLSFRKIKTLGSKLSRGKSFRSNKDSSSESVPVSKIQPKNEYCESLDSGLESDNSFDLSLSLKDKCASLEKSSQIIIRDGNESFASSEIIRRSSNRSSRTFDSGSRTLDSGVSPGCLVTHKNQSVPKKKVSILLPSKERNSSSRYGHHFQIEKTKLLGPTVPLPTQPRRSVSSQWQELITKAMQELMLLHPDFCDTICLIFNPTPNLRRLDSEEIMRLLFNLRSILFKSLSSVLYYEICIFIIQTFLYKVSKVLETIPSIERFPSQWTELMARSELFVYSRQQPSILQDTQALYIDLWCSLIIQY